MPEMEAIKQGHQGDGVREKPAAIVALAMAVSVPIIMIIIWLQFKSSEAARYRGLTRPTLAGPQNQPAHALPEPQLEIIPGASLAQLRAREDAELSTYGWISRESNIIRLPIERAMQLISQRGLPPPGPAKSDYELIIERGRDRNLAPLKEAK